MFFKMYAKNASVKMAAMTRNLKMLTSGCSQHTHTDPSGIVTRRPNFKEIGNILLGQIFVIYFKLYFFPKTQSTKLYRFFSEIFHTFLRRGPKTESSRLKDNNNPK